MMGLPTSCVLGVVPSQHGPVGGDPGEETYVQRPGRGRGEGGKIKTNDTVRENRKTRNHVLVDVGTRAGSRQVG